MRQRAMDSTEVTLPTLARILIFLMVLGGIGWNIYIGKILIQIQSQMETQQIDIQMLNERDCNCGKMLQDADRNKVLSTGGRSGMNNIHGDRNKYSKDENNGNHIQQKLIARRSVQTTDIINHFGLSRDIWKAQNPFDNRFSMKSGVVGDMNGGIPSNADDPTKSATDANSNTKSIMIGETRKNNDKIPVSPAMRLGPAAVGDQNNNKGLFSRWGRRTCGSSGTLLFEGVAVGFEQSSTVYGGQSLECIKSDAQVLTSFTAKNAGPLMFEAKLNLLGSFPTSSWATADKKKIPCSVCSWPANNLIVLFGSSSCSDGWEVLYYGYTLSQWKDGRTNVASTPICVDSSPDITLLSTPEFSTNVNNPNAPEFSFVRSSGSAFLHAGRLIPCVLCAQ